MIFYIIFICCGNSIEFVNFTKNKSNYRSRVTRNTPKNTPKSPVLGNFHDFLSFLGRNWPHFGSPRDHYRVKTKDNPLKHCFTSIYHGDRSRVTRNTPKITQKSPVLGNFHDFQSFLGRKWPHFVSPRDHYWVKTNSDPLKHCFTSIYHHYHIHPPSNHLKYTILVKILIWNLFSQKGCAKHGFWDNIVVYSIFPKEKVFDGLLYSGVQGTPRYVTKKPEFR